MKTKVVDQEKVESSLLDYHIQAAFVAARLGISLSHAFNRYVKPRMPEGPIASIREDQYELVWGEHWRSVREKFGNAGEAS